MAKKEVRQVRYLLSRRSEPDIIIEVPSDWRVTFGYVNPSRSSDGYARGEGHCMRVWEGEKLRAVFGNVTGMRDMDIPLARKVERETGSASWTSDSEGNFSKREDRQREVKLLSEEISATVFDEVDDAPYIGPEF